MDTITLNNIKLYAYHGCLEEETRIGSEYRVDVIVKADLRKPASTDSLKDTADYVLINHIVKEEMKIPSKLSGACSSTYCGPYFKGDQYGN